MAEVWIIDFSVETTMDCDSMPLASGKDSPKQAAVLRSAIQLFAERGFAATEVDAIAAAAGVAKGTVYHYFKSKDELFLAAAARSVAELGEFIFESIACIDEPVALIRTACRAVARYSQKHPEAVELFVQQRAVFRDTSPLMLLIAGRDEVQPYFVDVVRRAISAGVFREVDPQEVVRAISNMLYGLVVSSFLEGASEKLVTRTDLQVGFILDGLRTKQD